MGRFVVVLFFCREDTEHILVIQSSTYNPVSATCTQPSVAKPKILLLMQAVQYWNLHPQVDLEPESNDDNGKDLYYLTEQTHAGTD